MPATHTPAELVFMQRMLPHFMAGMTAAEAAAAVIEDDARIFTACCDVRQSHFVPTADERGYSSDTPTGKGDVIRSEISRSVYRKLRARAAIAKATAQ